MTLCFVDAAKPQIAAVKATKSLKLGREVRFRRSVDHAHWLLIEADPEVASFCEEPVWAADGLGGSPLADLWRAASRWRDRISLRGKVRTARRPGRIKRSRGPLERRVSFRSMTAAQILADPVLLDNASRVIGHASPSLHARAGLGGEG